MQILFHPRFLFCCLLLLLYSKTSMSDSCHEKNEHYRSNISIGVMIDQMSRVGKEHKVAIELAIQDSHHCLNVSLHIRDLNGSSAVELVTHDQVNAIVGTVTVEEATFLSEIPIVSLSASPQQIPPNTPLPSFLQMNIPISYQMQCIAAIVTHFQWKKVILIHEQAPNTDDSSLSNHLSDALDSSSSIDRHFSLPAAFIEGELKKIRSRNVKVIILAQSSLEFALILFQKAKLLGMIDKGYVWIVSDEIANFLDSVELSVILNMQGVIGLKTDYENSRELEFKSRFRRKYGTEYPAEEEKSSPSLYSLRAYDAISTLFKAATESSNISLTDFQGLSGRIRFENGLLSQKPVFRIVNVIGRSYREIAMWSPDSGFSSSNEKPMSSIYWPGGEQKVPKGWSLGTKQSPLKIGVPANGAFKQFVNVTLDSITGFSIDVFEAAVKQFPYDLHYVFVPFFGTYDEMVAQVRNRSLDVAVGDTEIIADRYQYASFTQPYIESGLQMVVTVKPGLKNSKFIALNPFTKDMWYTLAGMSISTGAVVWLSEYAAANEQFTKNTFLEAIGSILWLSVTIISLSHREHVKNSASHLVVAVWICVVFVVGASFTAVLSTMMTVPRLQPSIEEIDYLQKTDAVVGCNGNSFIVRYLIDVLHFKPENVQRIDSIDKYPKLLESGKIKAAFFVAPHAKIFLAEYCNKYTVSGPSFKLGGFGFVFPKGSQLETDMSEAILRVTQSGYVHTLEQKMLEQCKCSNSSSNKIDDGPRLGVDTFYSMFQVLIGAIAVAFCLAMIRVAKKNKCIGVDDLVQKILIHNRIGIWASLVLAEFRTKFGSTFFRQAEVVEIINVAPCRGETDPNLVAIQMAANINHQ